MGGQISILTNVLVAGEKMAIWATCTVIMCCVVFMLAMMLMLGVGVGYNYCYVDLASRYRYVPQQYFYPGSPRWPYRSGEIDEGLHPKGVLVTIPSRVYSKRPTITKTRQRYKFSRKSTMPVTLITLSSKNWVGRSISETPPPLSKHEESTIDPYIRADPINNIPIEQMRLLAKNEFKNQTSSINLVKSVNNSQLTDMLTQLNIDIENQTLNIRPDRNYTMYLLIM